MLVDSLLVDSMYLDSMHLDSMLVEDHIDSLVHGGAGREHQMGRWSHCSGFPRLAFFCIIKHFVFCFFSNVLFM